MNRTLKNQQYLIFLLLLGGAALLAFASYHLTRKEMVLFRQGEQKLAGKDFQGAVSRLTESFQTGNSSLKLLESLGDACFGAKKFPEAIEAYKAFLRQTPDNRSIRIKLVDVLTLSGRPDEAAVEYRKLKGTPP